MRSHPTGPAAVSVSQGDEHRRNTVGLPAKANSGLSSRPTTSLGSRPAVSMGWSSSASINSGGCYQVCGITGPGSTLWTCGNLGRGPRWGRVARMGAFGRRTTPMKFLVSSSQEGGGSGPLTASESGHPQAVCLRPGAALEGHVPLGYACAVGGRCSSVPGSRPSRQSDPTTARRQSRRTWRLRGWRGRSGPGLECPRSSSRPGAGRAAQRAVGWGVETESTLESTRGAMSCGPAMWTLGA